MVEGQDELVLCGPELDDGNLKAPMNRMKLLRAWIEMGAWYAYFTKLYGLFPCLPTVVFGFSNLSPFLERELEQPDYIVRTSIRIEPIEKKIRLGIYMKQCQ